uniref:Uncharacterized protein n=1 Tax=Chromera velia CCMP2878 TaxID=1169474 RepID=A0A0G4HUA1_9ALVE|eukprot:Cvel_8576.t1-p1 / transcript=Cvel_8576.t1 / gene=Cvel_8576 / organism=Chromera_velia_CCMP2878 / gene_product=hypothetical protein / transcript_product=hypothetical protein / location=Cvel_scaffold476:15862-19140(-) / protein_length=341 / sequence_SO=supercontig / SO=protein_coding / is_pseudo=false
MNDRDYETLRKAALEIKPGELRLVEKGLYGMPYSGNIFDKSLAGVQGEAGYERVETGVAVKRGQAGEPAVGVQINWIDDVFGARRGRKETVEEIVFLRSRFEWGHLSKLPSDASIKYASMDFSFFNETVEVSQNLYSRGVNIDALWRTIGEKRKKGEVKATELEPATEMEKEGGLEPLMRSINGVLHWMVRTRPSRHVWADKLSCHSTRPCRRVVRVASLPVLLLGLLEHLLVCHQHLERLAYLSDGVGPQWPLGLDKADDLPNHWRLGTPGSDHSACLEVKLRPTIGVRDGALNDFAPLHGSLQDRGVVADTDDRAVFIRSDEEVETTNSHGDGLTRGDF